MSDPPFDPWETAGSTATKVAVGTRTFTQTLYDRARKRLGDIERTGGRTWRVGGNSKLGDTYPSYEVRLVDVENEQYECDCYALSHGEQHARRTCSHVLAVMVYRFELRQTFADGGNEKGGGPLTASSDTQSLEQLDLSSTSVPVQGVQHEWVEEPVRDNGTTMASGEAIGEQANVPAISDSRFVEWDATPVPDKFVEIRPHQWDAVGECVENFQSGVEVNFVDAPTGSGKSLIAELVRRIMATRAFYICHSKTLQEQFAEDFAYARVLKGRSNYPTLDGGFEVSCADCTKNSPDDDCAWCGEPGRCPYEVAKREAIMSKLAILNTAYFLAEFNYVGKVGVKRELGIIDECDTLEGELMGFAEFKLGERVLNATNLSAPKKGTHSKTIGSWLAEEFRPALYEYRKSVNGEDIRAIRERMSLDRLMADVLRIEHQVALDENLTRWIRDNDAGPLVLKPVVVDDYGDRYVWHHAKRWLNMSATIISADELATSTGLVGGQGEGDSGQRWETVTVPMTFPVENRLIHVTPVADMSRKGKQNGEWEDAARALHNVCLRHPNERVLVHTVSYELARFFMDRVASTLERPVLSYSQSAARDSTLRRFKSSPNAVLIAASMDRGVDLAGDDCRVIVVAKIPFPYLGDPQVSKRMHMPSGQTWYVVQAVRKLVQMTGRAVRSKDDWCHCVSPETRVLTDDLRWIEAGKLAQGDGLLGFDEYSSRSNWRKWQMAEVEKTGVELLPRYRITLETGQVLVVTPNHKWLSKNGQSKDDHWVRTDQLHSNHYLNLYVEPWPEVESREIGWLEGFFDGEGCLTLHQGQRNKFVTGVQASQKPGLILEKAIRVAESLDFIVSCHPTSNAMSMNIQGGFAEHLRFLGQVRPQRLLDKLIDGEYGQRMMTSRYVKVERVEQILDGPMVTLQSSTGTFLAEGFAAHNTYIFDRQFTSNIWRKHKMLLPAWWREAVRTDFDVRELLR